MVTLKVFDNYFSANIVLSRLQQEGVVCYLRDEHTVTIDPLLNNAVGGIKLTVKSEHYEQALHLLQDFEKVYIQQAECPSCGQQQMEKLLQPVPADWRVKLVRIFIPDFENDMEIIYHCQYCNFETKTFPEKYAWYNIPGE